MVKSKVGVDSQTPSSSRSVPAAAAEVRLGFPVMLQLGPGLTPLAAEQFVQRYDNFLREHELLYDGAARRRFVFSADRSLSETDQLNLLSWLVREAQRLGLSMNVWLGPMAQEQPESFESGVWAWQGDAALESLLALYDLGRIEASVLLQLLKGNPTGVEQELS